MPAPGAIAALYEELGGKVTWVGKPYPRIYAEAARLIGNPRPILCIGDSAEHDVAGAAMRASKPSSFCRAFRPAMTQPRSLPNLIT